MNEQQAEVARKLCVKSNPTMEEIVAWDLCHNAKRWSLPSINATVHDTSNENGLQVV